MIYKYEKRSYKTFFRRKNSRRFIKNELRSGTRAKKRRNEIYQLKIPIDLLPGLRFRWWQSWWRLTRGRTWSRGRHAICSRILRYRVSRNNSVFFPWIFKILPALPRHPALGAAIWLYTEISYEHDLLSPTCRRVAVNWENSKSVSLCWKGD